MIIAELFDNGDVGYRTEKDDHSAPKLNDVRKTRLTLADLNRLRMANDVRKFEREKKIEQVSRQYKPATAGGEAGGMPGL